MSAATSGAVTGAIVAAELGQASSYRVKFKRDQFLELIDFARPRVIYHRGKNHFFAFDGFVMYCQGCSDADFLKQRLFETIELSNEVWSS